MTSIYNLAMYVVDDVIRVVIFKLKMLLLHIFILTHANIHMSN